MQRVPAFLLPALLSLLLQFPPVPAQAQSGQQIRVVLDDTAKAMKVKGELAWSTAGDKLASSASPAEVTVSGGKLTLKLDGKSYTSTRFMASPVKGYVQYEGKGFRGRLELFVGQNGNVVVLNVLPLEDYLYGVVPSEMSPSWPFEALKCQAVAARTYALSRIMENMGKSYDVYGNVSDQAYRGVSGESDNSSRAVDETAGEIVEYQGQVITAFYSACAGGMTKQGSAPYLRSVPSDHPDSPHHNWEVPFSLEDLSALVKSTGAEIGPIKDVTVEYDANSGHLLSLIVRGANDSKQLYGTTLRKLLGRSKMKSTLCRLYPAGSVPQPMIATAPPSQAPSVKPEAEIPAATKVSIGSTAPGEAGLETQESYGWLRPWVASADVICTVKMRNMYAYDGRNLTQCNRDMHMLSGLGGPVLAGNPAMESLPPTPTSSDAPLPDVKVVTARLERSELQGGMVLRGSGYGHGIGMSQWGARKLAEDGMDYRGILHYFYYGVDIVDWDNAGLQPGELPAGDEWSGDDNGFYEEFTAVDLGG